MSDATQVPPEFSIRVLDEDGVRWSEIWRSGRWRKYQFFGDSIETGDAADRETRYARLYERIKQDWKEPEGPNHR